MILSKTPFRISFFGGGTDLPAFYSKEFGCVISTSINKYMHVLIHESFDKMYKIAYSKIEHVSTTEEIKHEIVREVLRKLNIHSGLEIHSIAEVPAGTGLGSSSAFTVGLLNSLYAYLGKYISNRDLANEACTIEIENLKEPIGKQDQYSTSVGGLNYFQFEPDGEVLVEPIRLSKSLRERLNDRLVVFYLNSTRDASSVLSEQSKNISKNADTFEVMKKLKEITLRMKKDLNNGDISSFGEMLHNSWMLKKSAASNVSNKEIDNLYSQGILSGATGGKLLGAGGGGFLLFYCEPNHQASLRESFKDFKEFSFKFENHGTHVIYSN